MHAPRVCTDNIISANMSFSVAAILKIQNGVITAARSHVHISYMNLIITNEQYTKCHAFMTISTILVFDVP